MRTHITTALLVGALSAFPVVGFAAASAGPQTPAAAKQTSTHAAATHATRGVVKSLDDSTLVITGTGGKQGEMTFALNASTHREGTLAVGTPVSVRYREDGKTHVATAIRMESAKQQAHAAPSTR
jgi:hypothetical protein